MRASLAFFLLRGSDQTNFICSLKLSQVSGRTMGAVKPNGGARAFRQSTNKVKLVACQANRMCFSSAAAGSDEEQIKSIIADFAAVDGKDGKAPGVEHMTEDFLFVRYVLERGALAKGVVDRRRRRKRKRKRKRRRRTKRRKRRRRK